MPASRSSGGNLAMRNAASTLCHVLLCSAILLGSSRLATAQPHGLDGTYTLDEAASDDIHQVIEAVVGQLNFLTRTIARGRLRKLNPVYHQVVITSSSHDVSVTVDSQPALRTPTTGIPVAWAGPDGGKVNVSAQVVGGHLVQTFRSAEGRRVNDYLSVLTGGPSLCK
jgi:hypothetical protein